MAKKASQRVSFSDAVALLEKCSCKLDLYKHLLAALETYGPADFDENGRTIEFLSALDEVVAEIEAGIESTVKISKDLGDKVVS